MFPTAITKVINYLTTHLGEVTSVVCPRRLGQDYIINAPLCWEVDPQLHAQALDEILSEYRYLSLKSLTYKVEVIKTPTGFEALPTLSITIESVQPA